MPIWNRIYIRLFCPIQDHARCKPAINKLELVFDLRIKVFSKNFTMYFSNSIILGDLSPGQYQRRKLERRTLYCISGSDETVTPFRVIIFIERARLPDNLDFVDFWMGFGNAMVVTPYVNELVCKAVSERASMFLLLIDDDDLKRERRSLPPFLVSICSEACFFNNYTVSSDNPSQSVETFASVAGRQVQPIPSWEERRGLCPL